MILHLEHMVNSGCTKIMLRTVDTDVVVLVVAAVLKLNIEEAWVAFGVSKHFRYLPAHEMAKALGPERSSCLPMFHSFTGCDTVSPFNGIGKKTAWKAWQAYDVIAAFRSLSFEPTKILLNTMAVLEQFVVIMYDRASDQLDRQQMFTVKGRTIENIPSSPAALLQYTKHAVYQG